MSQNLTQGALGIPKVGLEVAANPVSIAVNSNQGKLSQLAESLGSFASNAGTAFNQQHEEFVQDEKKRAIVDSVRDPLKPLLSAQQSPQYREARMELWGENQGYALQGKLTAEIEAIKKDPSKLRGLDVQKYLDGFIADNLSGIDDQNAMAGLSKIVTPLRQKALGMLSEAKGAAEYESAKDSVWEKMVRVANSGASTDALYGEMWRTMKAGVVSDADAGYLAVQALKSAISDPNTSAERGVELAALLRKPNPANNGLSLLLMAEKNGAKLSDAILSLEKYAENKLQEDKGAQARAEAAAEKAAEKEQTDRWALNRDKVELHLASMESAVSAGALDEEDYVGKTQELLATADISMRDRLQLAEKLVRANIKTLAGANLYKDIANPNGVDTSHWKQEEKNLGIDTLFDKTMGGARWVNSGKEGYQVWEKSLKSFIALGSQALPDETKSKLQKMLSGVESRSAPLGADSPVPAKVLESLSAYQVIMQTNPHLLDPSNPSVQFLETMAYAQKSDPGLSETQLYNKAVSMNDPAQRKVNGDIMKANKESIKEDFLDAVVNRGFDELELDEPAEEYANNWLSAWMGGNRGLGFESGHSGKAIADFHREHLTVPGLGFVDQAFVISRGNRPASQEETPAVTAFLEMLKEQTEDELSVSTNWFEENTHRWEIKPVVGKPGVNLISLPDGTNYKLSYDEILKTGTALKRASFIKEGTHPLQKRQDQIAIAKELVALKKAFAEKQAKLRRESDKGMALNSPPKTFPK